jgi:hypothetical protein
VSEKAKYLGQIVSFDDRDVEINERISAGWRAFHKKKFSRRNLIKSNLQK